MGVGTSVGSEEPPMGDLWNHRVPFRRRHRIETEILQVTQLLHPTVLPIPEVHHILQSYREYILTTPVHEIEIIVVLQSGSIQYFLRMLRNFPPVLHSRLFISSNIAAHGRKRVKILNELGLGGHRPAAWCKGKSFQRGSGSATLCTHGEP